MFVLDKMSVNTLPIKEEKVNQIRIKTVITFFIFPFGEKKEGLPEELTYVPVSF